MSTILPTISTKHLFRHSRTLYSIDASEATDGGKQPLFGRAYDDSCDVGLALISHKTGQALKMVVVKEHRNRDNDVTHWELESDRTSMHHAGLQEPIYLTIWNT